jgi:hypothetical protein
MWVERLAGPATTVPLALDFGVVPQLSGLVAHQRTAVLQLGTSTLRLSQVHGTDDLQLGFAVGLLVAQVILAAAQHLGSLALKLGRGLNEVRSGDNT